MKFPIALILFSLTVPNRNAMATKGNIIHAPREYVKTNVKNKIKFNIVYKHFFHFSKLFKKNVSDMKYADVRRAARVFGY